jgi:Ca2+-binding RTX toxin-like protein
MTAVPAWASTCTFDAMTATVAVEVGQSETAVIGRSGDAITLDGQPCDTATVTTVDAIVVTTTGIPTEVALDLSGGGFGPGGTPENDGGNAEIEISIVLPAGSPTVRVIGGPNSDNVVLGADGINLDATEPVGDVDVAIAGLPVIVLDGNGGNDVLSVAGGSGTGAPSSGTLSGGPDGDLLLGALGGSTIDGGEGPDTADYSASQQLTSANLTTGSVTHGGGQPDQLSNVENLTGSPGADSIVGSDGPNVLRGGAGPDVLAGHGGNDTLDGGPGIDRLDYASSPTAVTVNLIQRTATGDGSDALSEIEDVTGSPAGDRLIGDAGANALNGGSGDDRVDGGGGDDALDGGSGVDRVEFALANDGVDVDLRDGTASGSGADTLASFESVLGTSQADTIHGDGAKNTLDGGGGSDELYGHGGRDEVIGKDGNDQLFGQKGKDDQNGGPGRDQLDGGKGSDFCRGGPDPDAFVFCEKIRLD